jgi:predicted enzyme related to lactoylglutathione lyase
MNQPRLDGINIACRDKLALSAFWCALLGTTVRGELGQYLGLHPVGPGQPRLLFQQVEDLREGGNRLHLDLECHDVAASTAEALALGAVLESEVHEFGMTWSVMRDPEGNVFCLVPQS